MLAFSAMENIISISLLTHVIIIFIIVRIAQRIYYILVEGQYHSHYWPSFSPRAEMEIFLANHGVHSEEYTICADSKEKDLPSINLRYRKLGTGKNVYLLANGVGTDFFMWYPMLSNLLKRYQEESEGEENLFDKITLLVPNYRGLFEPDDSQFYKGAVPITVELCVKDILDIMKHAKVSSLKGLIGWSTGAQVGLTLAANHPNAVEGLFLLNTSSGQTLHTALQPFIPLPKPIGNIISKVAHTAIVYLRELVPLPLWNTLKKFNDSILFHFLLVCLAFFGGFPPEQPVYFHEYMRDTFRTRSQTRALLDLILSLDAALPADAWTLSHPVVLLGGIPDFLTGIYHSTQLKKTLQNCKLVPFSMASHFLLIEWPDLVARELLFFINGRGNSHKRKKI